MCGVCGCGPGETRIDGVAMTGRDAHPHDHHHHHHHDDHHHDHDHHHHGHDHHHGPGTHTHVLADGTVIRHGDHDHGHAHDHGHHHHAHSHEPGQARLIAVEQDILAKNDRFAAVNRRLFQATGVLVLNLMSSPGSGKTTLLVRTLTDLAPAMPAAVIEGDQQTSLDADRIRATGVRAVQVNTGKGCHLDAHMITEAVADLDLGPGSVLFVENVGNLVCPAGFDLGEAARVVVISVTEGEDKPLKYPAMFAGADVMLVNKVDLLPHLSFDVDRLIANARKVNPHLTVIQVSATGGQGLADWYAWIDTARGATGRAAGRAAAASVPAGMSHAG